SGLRHRAVRRRHGIASREGGLLFRTQSRHGRRMKFGFVALLVIGIVGCATARPILYSNQKYQQVGRTTADRDIAECTALADQAGATPDQGRGAQVARNAGAGAVVGAASGAVGGAIAGDPGIGAAAGPAGGGAWEP